MGFILIDFKKRADSKTLRSLVPQGTQKMDEWIANFTNDDETPPTEEECAALETAQIESILAEFDEVAGNLWRVKEEVPDRRTLLEKHLGWKRGKLFGKFSGEVAALVDQAAATMVFCVASLQESQDDLDRRMPIAESGVDEEFDELLKNCADYVERTYPDGVAGLDAYDDTLPDDTPTYKAFLEMVEAKRTEYKTLNTEAIPQGIERIRESSHAMFRAKINEAIQAAMAAIEEDLSDDVLPYLEEEAMAELRQELIAASQEYGNSRLDND